MMEESISQSTITVKINYEGDLRRVHLSSASSFGELENAVCTRFDLGGSLLKGYQLQYVKFNGRIVPVVNARSLSKVINQQRKQSSAGVRLQLVRVPETSELCPKEQRILGHIRRLQAILAEIKGDQEFNERRRVRIEAKLNALAEKFPSLMEQALAETLAEQSPTTIGPVCAAPASTPAATTTAATTAALGKEARILAKFARMRSKLQELDQFCSADQSAFPHRRFGWRENLRDRLRALTERFPELASQETTFQGATELVLDDQEATNESSSGSQTVTRNERVLARFAHLRFKLAKLTATIQLLEQQGDSPGRVQRITACKQRFEERLRQLTEEYPDLASQRTEQIPSTDFVPSPPPPLLPPLPFSFSPVPPHPTRVDFLSTRANFAHRTFKNPGSCPFLRGRRADMHHGDREHHQQHHQHHHRGRHFGMHWQREGEVAPMCGDQAVGKGQMVWCDGCSQQISNEQTRYKCADCPNFDLCSSCEEKNLHEPTHAMIKLRPEARATHPRLPIGRPVLARFAPMMHVQKRVDPQPGQMLFKLASAPVPAPVVPAPVVPAPVVPAPATVDFRPAIALTLAPTTAPLDESPQTILKALGVPDHLVSQLLLQADQDVSLAQAFWDAMNV